MIFEALFFAVLFIGIPLLIGRICREGGYDDYD